MPSVVFRRDHLRFTSGIICGSGSFAVQFGDHFRSGDHLRSGIICGAVHDLNDQVREFCNALKNTLDVHAPMSSEEISLERVPIAEPSSGNLSLKHLVLPQQSRFPHFTK